MITSFGYREIQEKQNNVQLTTRSSLQHRLLQQPERLGWRRRKQPLIVASRLLSCRGLLGVLAARRFVVLQDTVLGERRREDTHQAIFVEL